jgi:hypothetical protein
VQMQFSDLDGDITRRLRLHGTGIPVRFYFFYPQNGAVVCRFEGRLGAPEIGLQVPGHALGLDKVALKAVGGLQSWQQPLPGRGFSTDCAAIHGGELDDPADVRANVECDWDLHVGGSKGLPVYHPDGTLRRFCNKDIADCIAHWGDATRILAAGKVVVETTLVGDGKHKTLSTSVSNEPRLRNLHLGVAYGRCQLVNPRLIGLRRETNPSPNNQAEGTLVTEWNCGEGRVRGLSNISALNRTLPRPGRVPGLIIRRGEHRQLGTGFTANSLNHSHSVIFRGDFNPIDPRFVTEDELQQGAKLNMDGKDDIKQWQLDGTYTEAYTENGSDIGIDLLTATRYGLRYPISKLRLSDIVEGRAAAARVIEFTDDKGQVRQCVRSQFNQFVESGQARDVMRELLQVVSFVLVTINGAQRWLPQDAEILDNRIPVFSDVGGWGQRNIIYENGRSTLQVVPHVSDAELINEVVVQFADASANFTQRTLNLRDEAQQKKAAKIIGQRTPLKKEKAYPGWGIINEAQAVRYGMLMRDLGPFRQGGIKNNWRASFLTPAWWVEARMLHEHAIFQLVSPALAGINEDTGRPIEYFQVLSLEEAPNLAMRVTGIAYPADYIESMERAAIVVHTDDTGGDGISAAEYGGSTVQQTVAEEILE